MKEMIKFHTMWSRKKKWYQNGDLSGQAKMASLTSGIGKRLLQMGIALVRAI